jgi:hypothetical protein
LGISDKAQVWKEKLQIYFLNFTLGVEIQRRENIRSQLPR